jgi:hypothetical protein
MTCPPKILDEHGVVGFGVTEDDRGLAACDRAGDEAFDEGGFTGAGLAEHEHPRVGD